MTGLFAQWQPEYAARGLATFPVRDKKPAIGNYLNLGRRGSGELVKRFANDDAFGIACRRSGLTIVDVDSTDERLFAAAIDRYGPTPILIRSGSGNYQAWYRSNGEKRRVRPNKGEPIDILGDGYVVAPPSVGATAPYTFIEGSLDDLNSLPVMRAPATPAAMTAKIAPKIGEGRRNDTLWAECMRAARECPSLDALISFAVEKNALMFSPPLPDSEVVRTATSAWKKEMAGENWFGRGGRVVLTNEEVDGMLSDHPDAILLLTRLRRDHWGHPTFQAANDLGAKMGWPPKRMAAARKHLLEIGELIEVRKPSTFHGPGIYRFKGGRK